jgi:hypothetical protein
MKWGKKALLTLTSACFGLPNIASRCDMTDNCFCYTESSFLKPGVIMSFKAFSMTVIAAAALMSQPAFAQVAGAAGAGAGAGAGAATTAAIGGLSVGAITFAAVAVVAVASASKSTTGTN